MTGVANDPGLGNRYLFTGGQYRGRIGVWAGAGDDGVHMEWEGLPGSVVVSYAELGNARVATPDEKGTTNLTLCPQCKGRGRWGPGPRQHCLACRATGFTEGALSGYDLPEAPTYGYAPVDD